MNKRTEKSCFEMVQGKQEVLTGDFEGLTWEEFEKKVMRWAHRYIGQATRLVCGVTNYQTYHGLT